MVVSSTSIPPLIKIKSEVVELYGMMHICELMCIYYGRGNYMREIVRSDVNEEWVHSGIV